MCEVDVFSRRRFNALLVSAGAAYALTPALRGEDAFPDVSTPPKQPPFLHPGMLHSQGDLVRMRGGLRQGTQPILAGFEVLHSHPLSQLTYSSGGAFAEIGRNPNVHTQEFDRDSNAAYQCALMSCITGDLTYATISIGILNAWSKTLRVISGADAVLCAALGGFKMVNAAELMRHSNTGWANEDAALFGKMLYEVFVPVIDNFAPFANGNWDTAAMKMMVAIAIYGDDRALFERTLRYYRFGCGDGQLAHYIYPNGQCQESGRDQQHTQLGLAHMGDCCEMAWHQGLDLYASLDNRLLLGFEYTARYNLGEEVPFEPDIDRTGKYRHEVISARSTLRPVYEQIYNHYVHRKGLPAPWTQRAAERLRPEGAVSNADHTGFGTLLYTRETGPDTAEAAPVAVPSGLHARGNNGAIELDFVPLARPTHYTISRTEGDSVAFAAIGRNAVGPTYRDSGVKLSRLYTYHVKAVNSPRTALPIKEMAGLPPGWRQDTLGQMPGRNAASFDGESFCLSARGTPQPSHAVSAFLTHCEMPPKSRFTARVVPLIASQYLQLGVAVLSNDKVPVLEAALSLSPHGEMERPAWFASLLRADRSGTSQTVNSLPLSAPIITYGRMVEPFWLRLDRDGRTLLAAVSADGASWSEVGTTSIPSGGLRVGLLVNSGMDKVTTEVCFDRVSLAPTR
jgi:Alginate lyase